MRRAQVASSSDVQWMRRLNPMRLLSAWRRRGLWGVLALAAAILACYGTLALVGLLSAMGVGLVINEGAWSGTITAFAALALVAIAAGWRKHGSIRPLLPAVLGFGLIAYTMFGEYSRAVELAGFMLLTVATLWDYRLRRYDGVEKHVANLSDS